MRRITLAALAAVLAAGAALTAPVAASAAAVYPPGTPSITGAAAGTITGSIAPGGRFTVAFNAIFRPDHELTIYFFSVGTVPESLGAFQAAQSPALAAESDARGAATVSATMPADASAPVTIEATDGTTTAAITIPVTAVAAVAGATGSTARGAALPTTGTYLSLATVWAAIGLVALGGGLLATRRVTRFTRGAAHPGAHRG
ncbi:MAG TPA: hypothetical protein VGC45_10405 [Gryllotalpicola sp.]